MKKLCLLLALLAVFTLGACGGDGGGLGKLGGEWTCDVEETIAYQGVAPDANSAAMAAQMLKPILGQMVLKLDAGKSRIFVGMAGEGKEQEYEINSEKDNVYVLKLADGNLALKADKGKDGKEILIVTPEGGKKTDSVVFIRK